MAGSRPVGIATLFALVLWSIHWQLKRLLAFVTVDARDCIGNVIPSYCSSGSFLDGALLEIQLAEPNVASISISRDASRSSSTPHAISDIHGHSVLIGAGGTDDATLINEDGWCNSGASVGVKMYEKPLFIVGSPQLGRFPPFIPGRQRL